MSTISLQIVHGQQLWTMYEKGADLKTYSHKLPEHDAEVRFSDFGITIICEYPLSDTEQLSLANCLMKEKAPYTPPHWQNLTPDLHRTVQGLEAKLLKVARLADHGFRKSAKGVRLPPAKIQKIHINQSQAFPVMNWRLSDAEKERLTPHFEQLPNEARLHYERSGIPIPFSVSFGQKQIFLHDQEVSEAFDTMDGGETYPPFWALYGIASETFAANKSHDAAILILATCIENALKWCLQEQGDQISNFLIEHTQSPPLRKLYDCACQTTLVNFPDHFGGWLGQLSLARNFVAHKPRQFDIDFLQMGRWFAVGEAILKSLSEKENNELVGFLVRPIGDRAAEQFTPDARGVVLRQEEFRDTGDKKLHVLMDTGETYYFSDSSFEKLPDREQKFPDIS